MKRVFTLLGAFALVTVCLAAWGGDTNDSNVFDAGYEAGSAPVEAGVAAEGSVPGVDATQAAVDGSVATDAGAPIRVDLFDCGKFTDFKVGVAATNYVTTAALEETLHCKDRGQAFKDMKTKVPVIGDFRDGT